MQYTMMRIRRWFPAWRLALAVAGILPAAAHASSKMDVESAALPLPSGNIILIIDGAIKRWNQGNEAHLDLEMIQSLPTYSLRTSTSVTDGVRQFEGVLARHILELVSASGKIIEAQALNNYSVDIPINDFYDYDVLLATHMDGEQLLPSDKGPLWIVYPRDGWRKLQDIRYDYRWVWQLHRLTVK